MPLPFARSWVPLRQALENLALTQRTTPAETTDLLRQLLDDNALRVRMRVDGNMVELPPDDQPRLLFNRVTGRAWLAAEPGAARPPEDWGTDDVLLHWATLRGAAQLLMLPAAHRGRLGRPVHEMKAAALSVVIRTFGLGREVSRRELVQVMQDACIEAHPDNHPDERTLIRWAAEIAAGDGLTKSSPRLSPGSVRASRA
jgi:hypothetical protein